MNFFLIIKTKKLVIKYKDRKHSKVKKMCS